MLTRSATRQIELIDTNKENEPGKSSTTRKTTVNYNEQYDDNDDDDDDEREEARNAGRHVSPLGMHKFAAYPKVSASERSLVFPNKSGSNLESFLLNSLTGLEESHDERSDESGSISRQ